MGGTDNASGPGDVFGDVLPWLLALATVVVVGAVVIYLVRRMLNRETDGSAEGFSLQELRELNAAGELSDEEFERAKASIIGRLSGTEKAPDAREDSSDDESEP